MSEIKGLILAGGDGTRLRPITYGLAKQLIPIANKPVLFYALEALKNAGIDNVIVNVAVHSKIDVINAIKDGSSFGLNVQYSTQDKPLGIAHAIKIAEPLIGDNSFVVYLGDNILKEGINKHVKEFVRIDADAMALVSRVSNPERFGTVELEGDKIKKVVEKPKVPTSDLAMVGVYFFKPIVFESMERIQPSWRGELEVVDLYQDMINNDKDVRAIIVDKWWIDTGEPDDIFEANRIMLDDLESYNLGKLEEGALIQGKVGIGKGTVIRRGSVIRGPTIIGEKCEIGPNVFIGSYTSIGSRVFITQGELENSIIMDGSKIKCKTRITDSIIGQDVIIETKNSVPKGINLILGQKSYINL